jgi:hypothetical protein
MAVNSGMGIAAAAKSVGIHVSYNAITSEV